MDYILYLVVLILILALFFFIKKFKDKKSTLDYLVKKAIRIENKFGSSDLRLLDIYKDILFICKNEKNIDNSIEVLEKIVTLMKKNNIFDKEFIDYNFKLSSLLLIKENYKDIIFYLEYLLKTDISIEIENRLYIFFHIFISYHKLYQYNKSLYFQEKIFELNSIDNILTDDLIHLYLISSYNYYYLRNFDLAINYSKKVINDFNIDKNNYKIFSRTYFLLSNVYTNMVLYTLQKINFSSDSHKYKINLLDYSLYRNKLSFKSNILMGISFTLKLFHLLIDYPDLKNELKIFDIYNYLFINYCKIHNYKEAKKYVDKAFDIVNISYSEKSQTYQSILEWRKVIYSKLSTPKG